MNRPDKKDRVAKLPPDAEGTESRDWCLPFPPLLKSVFGKLGWVCVWGGWGEMISCAVEFRHKMSLMSEKKGAHEYNRERGLGENCQ